MRYNIRSKTGAFAVFCYALITTACCGSPADYNYLYQAVLSGDTGTVNTCLEDGGDVEIRIAQFAEDDQMGWVGTIES